MPRTQWTFEPQVSVGPLRFGMSHTEVEEVLDVRAGSTQGRCCRPVSRAEFTELGVRTRYTSDGRLCYVAVDALFGPKVAFDGIPLAGGIPTVLTRRLDEHTRSRGLGPLAGDPARGPHHERLGLILRPHRHGDLLLTSPAFFTTDWIVEEAGTRSTPDTGPNLTGRVRWDAEPLVRVGPLRFGMSPKQVIDVLGVEPVRQEMLPDDPAPLISVGLRLIFLEPAVTAYFDKSGPLSCIAVDGARGPQVTLAGSDLVGQIPSDLEDRFIHHFVGATGHFYYTLQGDPASDELGIVLRTQRAGDFLVTRPFFTSLEWAERHHDTYDGPVPETEWRAS